MRYRATYRVSPVGGMNHDSTLEFETTYSEKAIRYAQEVRKALKKAIREVDLDGDVAIVSLVRIEKPAKMEPEQVIDIPLSSADISSFRALETH